MPYYCLSIPSPLFSCRIPAHLPGWRRLQLRSGRPALTPAFIKSVIEHYWLPFFSLVIVFIGGQSLGMRAMSIYELDADYVHFARSLGVPDGRIVRYIFRNAMLPQVTGLALAIGSLVSGALITEIVFGYPGIGSLLFTSIRQSDYPVIQGVTLLIMIGVLLANFIVDIAYGIIDPRIRAGSRGTG